MNMTESKKSKTRDMVFIVSLGNAPSSVIVAVVRKFVLLLPLIYIMPQVMGDPTIGVYTAEPIADVIAVTFTAILFFFQFRKALKRISIGPDDMAGRQQMRL